MIRETSMKTYGEIKDEGIYDSRMDEVLTAVRDNPLMTGREYATLILGYQDMNIVRPRLSDLRRLGYIIEVGKRTCALGGRTSYVWTTLEGLEQLTLRKLGFSTTQHNLYSYNVDEHTILFQDFRKGQRRSYVITNTDSKINYKDLDIYKRFKYAITHLSLKSTV